MSFIVKPAQPAMRQLLVVDDDRVLRRVLVTLLEAADGVSALAQIQDRRFDLIILDLGLPHISGLQILSEIQKLESPPKVIVVTADDTAGAVLQAIRDQAYQYVVKPTPPKTIVG